MNKLNIATVNYLISELHSASAKPFVTRKAYEYTDKLTRRYEDCDTRGYEYLDRVTVCQSRRNLCGFSIFECTVDHAGYVFHFSGVDSKRTYNQACGFARMMQNQDFYGNERISYLFDALSFSDRLHADLMVSPLAGYNLSDLDIDDIPF